MTRVFFWRGKVAHLLPEDRSPNSYDAALCGRSPKWMTYWIGTGSQAEIDLAWRLPTCKQCEERA